MPKNTLLLFTNEYPYGKGESFIENELKLHSAKFDKIILIPLAANGEGREIPANVSVVKLSGPAKYNPLKLLSRHLIQLSRICIYELFRGSFFHFIRRFAEMRSILLQNFYRAELLEKYIQENNIHESSVFYSFWTDDWATVLSILRQRKKINGFVSRVHGYDLYKERWKDRLIPFRHFQLQQASKIIAVSMDGLRYLKKEYPSSANKFLLNHLGSPDMGISPFAPDGLFTIVSCSALIPLKRVHLLARALKEIQFELRWIHFGDGPLKEELVKECGYLPANVKTELRGYVPLNKIIDFYRTNSVNIFVSLSETEGGVPLSLREAASFGIPLLGVSVGGVPEIVNESTGILLPEDFDFSKLPGVLTAFKASEKNTIAFHTTVRDHWSDRFNASSSYSELYQIMMNL